VGSDGIKSNTLTPKNLTNYKNNPMRSVFFENLAFVKIVRKYPANVEPEYKSRVQKAALN